MRGREGRRAERGVDGSLGCAYALFGPFTGAALKSILCLLRAGVLDGEEEEEEEEKEEGMELEGRFSSTIPRKPQQQQEKEKAYRQERRAQAASAFGDGLIHCRFEETDAQGDEVVKMRIIELLAEALEDPGVGSLLEDESVWEVVQTCFVNRNEIAHSRQLCHTAEQVRKEGRKRSVGGLHGDSHL